MSSFIMNTTMNETRKYWLDTMLKICGPVIDALAERRLRRDMPVETAPGAGGLDIVACPYVRYFTELGCPELAKIYCANDDRVYGNLPGLEFKRTGTLGTGADRCDFYLRKT